MIRWYAGSDLAAARAEADHIKRVVSGMSEARNATVVPCPCDATDVADDGPPVCIVCGGPRFVALGPEVLRLRAELDAARAEAARLREALASLDAARNAKEE